MYDHIHMFVGLKPIQALSDLMCIVIGESSEWVNKQQFTDSPFRWQGGFGAFSYANSQIPVICNYIENQEIHHRKKSFEIEYRELLKEFDIKYDEQYTFHPLQ